MAVSSISNFPDPYHQYPYIPSPRTKSSTAPTKLYFKGRCRLGNLIFQLTGALSASGYYGRQLVIDLRMHTMLNAAFGFDERGLTSSLYKVGTFPENLTHYELTSPSMGFKIETFQIENKNDFSIFNWFQSWKYFQHRQKEIRQLFRFADNVLNNATASVSDCLKQWKVSREEVTLISIHVRRGDVMYNQKVPSMSYFLAAMEYFRSKYENVFFILCTNDIEWSQENFKEIPNVRIVRNSFEVDMAVLASCNHSVMSVGSFGWWGAWLAGGEVIYYNEPPRMIQYLFPASDYYVHGWIPMTD